MRETAGEAEAARRGAAASVGVVARAVRARRAGGLCGGAAAGAVSAARWRGGERTCVLVGSRACPIDQALGRPDGRPVAPCYVRLG